MSVDQIKSLIDYLEGHPELALGRISRSKEGRSLAKRLWQECAENLNSISLDCCQKTGEQWRVFYNEYKYRLVKKIRKEKLSRAATGGGPSNSAKLSSLEERLYIILEQDIGEPLPGVHHNTLIMSAKKLDEDNIISIEIVDDVTEESHHSKIPANEVGTGINEASSSKKWDFDLSTPYSSLKRPMSTPLKCCAKKEKMAENGNLVRQLLREKKISIMDNLQELELKKIKESIRHAQEVHDQKLRHNEERHQLGLEKLKLDIAMLKKSLDF